MSDMHCHVASKEPDESFLRVQSLRCPAAHHPIEALLQLIREERLETSALLLPGDFANKASYEGLGYGWDVALEVGRELRAAKVIPSLGNHDVDSHNLHHNGAMFAARYLRPGFPFGSNPHCRQFFDDGFCLITSGDLEVVVVNTVVGHLDPTAAKKGNFPIERIQTLRGALPEPKRGTIRIALMHHHPILHSSPFLNESDVIESGDQLLCALREKGVGLVIHGHKHQCRLTSTHTAAGPITVFAAGSFSAMLGEIASVSRNLFHVLDIEVSPSSDVPLRGIVRNWEWAKGTGWVQAKLLPFRMGFGKAVPIDQIVETLSRLAGSRHQLLFDERELLKAVPDLNHLMQDEFQRVVDVLRDNHRLQLSVGDDNTFKLERLVGRRTSA